VGRLQDKVIIVTGASRGLGEYCAVGYGAEGATVVVAARTVEEKDPGLPGTIHDTARKVEAAGGEALPVVCNVADQGAVQAMVDQVLERYGRVDVLMNNAGILPPGGVADIPLKHWDLLFRVNVHGTFWGCRAVLPAMRAQRSGSIVNISSVAADRAAGPYSATKMAVEGLTRGLAEDVRADGIAVNALKPVGAIPTPGMNYGRPARDESDLPGPESYVEAAVLLALQTAETCTGEAFNDVQALERLSDEATRSRLLAGRS
jgi:citronellol/citronellal dehydrogenase